MDQIIRTSDLIYRSPLRLFHIADEARTVTCHVMRLSWNKADVQFQGNENTIPFGIREAEAIDILFQGDCSVCCYRAFHARVGEDEEETAVGKKFVLWAFISLVGKLQANQTGSIL